MFLIGDVHVNSMVVEDVIKNLELQLAKSKEENIIFMGDFVYHFNYDRKAILRVFDFILDLYKKGKNVYVLAGNHDWIVERFIWEESQKLISNMSNNSKNELLFISEPLLKNIEGKDILFFPYNVSLLPEDKEKALKTIPYLDVKALGEAEDIKSKISLNINLRLYEEIERYKKEKGNKELVIVHHYYFTDMKFTGQRSVFTFKDISLSWKFLETEHKFISWHLHTPFTIKNYLCTWSLYNSSVLENNTFKFLQTVNFDNNKVSVIYHPLKVNSYILLKREKEDGLLTKLELLKIMQDIFKQNCNTAILSNFWDTTIEELIITEDDLRHTNLVLATDSITYDNIFEYVDEELLGMLKDYKIKKKAFAKIEEEIKKLDISNFNLEESFGDWKKLLAEYITTKYPDDYEEYLQILKNAQII